MSDSLKHNIFNETECISEQTLFDYIDKKLSAKENHIVEKHMLHCELCSDALEGLQLVKNRERIHIIDQKIKERIATPKNDTKIVTFNYKVILSVAATVLLLIGGVFFFNMLNHKNEMADFKQEQSVSEPAPPPPAPIVEKDSKGGSDTSPKEESTEESEAPLLTKSTTIPSKKPVALEQDKKADADYGAGIVLENAPIEGNGAYKDISVAGAVSENKKPGTPSKASEDNLQERAKEEPEELKKTEATGLLSDDDKAYDVMPISATATPPKSAVADNAVTRGQIDRDSEKANKKDEKSSRHEMKEKRKSVEKENAAIAYAPQSVTTNTESDETIQTVAFSGNIDPNPIYPGGQDSLISFIQRHLNHSVVQKNQPTSNQMIQVEFTIDENGYLKNPKIIKGLNSEIDKDVLRVLKMVPKWTPAKNSNEETISKKVALPIRIN